MPRENKKDKTGAVIRAILSDDFGTCSQVDLTDMLSSSHQTQYRWIIVYQCPLINVFVVGALMSKRAAEAAFQLLDTFLLFGMPYILHSFNGSEITAEVIHELKDIWPIQHIVHGKPCHLQCQRSVKRANADIRNMLAAWLSYNHTQDWSLRLHDIQNQKNSACHAG